MKAALYFPMLRAKVGEFAALGHLSPLARARVRPIIDLPKPKVSEKKRSVEDLLLEISISLARSWGTAYPVFIDFSRYGPEEITASGEHPVEYFFGLLRQQGVQGIPVAGPISVRGPGPHYLDAVSRIARGNGRGIGLRLPFHELSRPDTLAAIVQQELDRSHLPSDAIDVFLDLEALALLPNEDAGAFALQAVLTEAIGVLAKWRFRTLVLCGSSLPAHIGKEHDWNPVEVERVELAVWKGLLGRNDLPPIRFGDYAVVYPFQDDVDIPVRPPSRVRISSANAHVIYRAKPDEYRALCAAALRDLAADELPRCWGSQELTDCARGAINEGGPSQWIARDTNFHLEATIQVVEREMRRLDLLAGIDLETPQVMPWLQEPFPAENGR